MYTQNNLSIRNTSVCWYASNISTCNRAQVCIYIVIYECIYECI